MTPGAARAPLLESLTTLQPCCYLWRVPEPVAGSTHGYKYRLACVVRGVCVLRYDNEAGKGDHRHDGSVESPYSFSTPEQLIADLQRDMARWNDENSHP